MQITQSNTLLCHRWLVATASIAAFAAAAGIAANDAANSWGTCVGAGTICMKRAVLCAVLCEVCGAVFLASSTTQTLYKGVASYKCFAAEPDVLIVSTANYKLLPIKYKVMVVICVMHDLVIVLAVHSSEGTL
jgi:Phosphate transporter family